MGNAVGIRFSNPWWVVGGAVIGLFVCNGPVLAFTFGVFLKPLMADMGWQRGTASFALSFGGIFSAVMVPVIGAVATFPPQSRPIPTALSAALDARATLNMAVIDRTGRVAY